MIKGILLTLAAVSTIGLNTVNANNINYNVTNSQPNIKGYIKIATIGNIDKNNIKQSLEKLGINFDQYCNTLPNWQQKPDNSVPNIPNVPSIPDNPSQDNNTNQSEFAQKVVDLVNQERAKAGLSPLSIDTTVSSAALTRAKEIEKSFSHTRPNGSSFSTALTEKGIKFMGSGENIAYGQKTPEQVMQGWMNSAGHRANILNPKFTSIGVGHYQNVNGTNYWVQLFTY